VCYFSEIKWSAELPTPDIIIHDLISTYASMRIGNTYFVLYVEWIMQQLQEYFS
jgi:hypothetical protein